MSNEFRLEIKVKNNLIYKKITDAGYKSVSDFCKNNGIKESQLNPIVSMRISPFNHSDGSFKPVILEFCEVMGCLPEELFTDEILNARLKTNNFVYEVNQKDMQYLISQCQAEEPMLLEEKVDRDRKIDGVYDLIDQLTPREKLCVSMKYGLKPWPEPQTLEAIAREIGVVTRERVRQILFKAEKKMKHPSRSQKLRDLIGKENMDEELENKY